MKLSRRNVIKNSLLAAAGATIGTSIPDEITASNNTSSSNTYELKRNIKVADKYDIVVAGGGPAGIAAAVCAARLGAKVLLIEATGCLGGMGTSGLVTAYDPMATDGKLLVGGFMKEILFDMYFRGFLGPTEKPEIFTKKDHHWTKFNAEGYKLLLDEKVVEAGIEVRFFTKVIDAEANAEKGTLDGVIIHNIEGYEYIPSKTFIDCTGDAVLADLCGAACREAGRDTPNIMPATLTSYFANINWDKAKNIQSGTNSKILLQAISDGHFTQPDKHLPGCSQVGKSIGYLNGGHVFNLDALRCKSLTEGMMLGRRIAKEYLAYFRKYVPGFENAEHACTANLMGVRESRRIVGEYELCFDDYISKREFPDQIGIFNKFVDIHVYDTSEEEFKRFMEEKDETGRLKEGEYFGIPYSIIVPQGWKNLWVAGRCNSSDIKVHGSIRVQPAASMMGQAAGTAAVQSINTGQPANDLDTEMLITTLRKEGANLPQKQLSKEMTRM